jgi:tetraacyldisaccharide 4'-kinase
MTLWYERSTPPTWLLPLGLLFGLVSQLRKRWVRPVRLPVRVVVIGNLAVGGSGKTPLVAWLARELQSRSLRVGIVLRGYGGQQAEPLLVTPETTAEQVGDEARWLADTTGVPVSVGSDRVAAVRSLLADSTLDIVLSDDGLQHYRLGRDAEVIAIDAQRGLGNGALLPAGPLRESAARLAKADVIVLKGEGHVPVPKAVACVRMRCSLEYAERLSDGTRRPLSEFRGHPLHALAAIANPESFFSALEAAGLEIKRIPLADHAPVTEAIAGAGADRPMFVTTKDAVKIADPPPHVWQVPLEVAFSADDAGTLLSRVRGDARTE